MSTQLIQNYDLRFVTPACHPEAISFSVYVDLQDDIAEVLPFLNAELGGFDYNHSAKILLWVSNDKRRYAFRPHEIVVAPVECREEAQELVNNIIDQINDIWNRRNEIEPNFEGKRTPPKVLDIYKLLPKTNCKECGSPTCMAFAAALRNDPGILPLCPDLSQADYMELVSQE